MGCFYSCCCCDSSDDDYSQGSYDDGYDGLKETEMKSKKKKRNMKGPELAISQEMSAPSITNENKLSISGFGLALAQCNIEQDSAYWEWHIDISDVVESHGVYFGVTTKKDYSFYQGDEDCPEHGNGRELMREIIVNDNDTVGVCVQFSDLPMLQFMLNGEPLHDIAINRFRGTIYPSIYLPNPKKEIKDEATGKILSVSSNIRAKVVFNENKFKELSPHARFGPVIIARGLL